MLKKYILKIFTLFYKDMSNLVCPKCNKEFKTNSGFNKHIERKICHKIDITILFH